MWSRRGLLRRLSPRLRGLGRLARGRRGRGRGFARPLRSEVLRPQEALLRPRHVGGGLALCPLLAVPPDGGIPHGVLCRREALDDVEGELVRLLTGGGRLLEDFDGSTEDAELGLVALVGVLAHQGVDEVEGRVVGLARAQGIFDALDGQRAEPVEVALSVLEHEPFLVVEREEALLVFEAQVLHRHDEAGRREDGTGEVAIGRGAQLCEVVDDVLRPSVAALDGGFRQLPRGSAVGRTEAQRAQDGGFHEGAELLQGTGDELRARLPLLGEGHKHLHAVEKEVVESRLLGAFTRLHLVRNRLKAVVGQDHEGDVLEFLDGHRTRYFLEHRCGLLSRTSNEVTL